MPQTGKTQVITTSRDETETLSGKPGHGVAVSVRSISKVYRIWSTPAARLTGPLLEAGKRLLRAKSKKPSDAKQQSGSTSYRNFHALKEISFNLNQGESLGIIGLNGSGKSTLLQIIAGTLQASEGEVSVKGRVAALLELGSGFSPEFTGKENVYLNASLLGLSKREIDAKYQQIVDFADIGEFINQPVKTYSSGMIVRLAFAVIAHVDADILLIDEALSVGDARFTQKCMRFLRKFREEHAILFVTHDIAAIQSLCDRCLWLRDGQVEAIGQPKEITTLYGETLCGFEPSATKNAQSETPFKFNPNANTFGTGEAIITDLQLLDEETSKPLTALSGGEQVLLQITAKVNQSFNKPIIGFTICNQFGQALFCANTHEWYKDAPVAISVDQKLVAAFHFRMPMLPAGDYSLATSIADGTYESHQQHHWNHETMIIKSTNHIPLGLVGMPMDTVTLRAIQ